MYNCEKQIGRVLERIAQIDNYKDIFSEIIVVDNQSKDNSIECAKRTIETLQMPARILKNRENRSLGGSHKTAFLYAIEHGFDYVIVLHGDDQGDISNIVPYLESGEYRNYDCFLGARFMKGSCLEGYSGFRTFGNIVYNLLFSVVCGKWITDLGSGLNLYRVSILESDFYLKYKDNLMFNYCMIMGSTFYRHRIKFFPIIWREDDQVSNVKMVNQAVVVLKLLGSFLLHRKKFVVSEHRDRVVESYDAAVVYENQVK